MTAGPGGRLPLPPGGPRTRVSKFVLVLVLVLVLLLEINGHSETEDEAAGVVSGPAYFVYLSSAFMVSSRQYLM